MSLQSGHHLAAVITGAASKHTYFTIRFLVDRDRASEAYRAYAYFRWVDDLLDQPAITRPEREAFLSRQRAIMHRCYRGDWPRAVSAEEHMLVDLIRGDQEKDSGLQSYIRNMMAVMAFDADRRGRLISREQLGTYSRLLATAVTEALHYFIGHNCSSPRNATRYLAVTAAHITHMLRDTREDVEAGYFNIPAEFLEARAMGPADLDHEGYRQWVRSRVRLAREYFAAGRKYLAQIESLRCRLAGYAYMKRFEGVLEAIERDDYRLRPHDHETKSPGDQWKAGWSVLSPALHPSGIQQALPSEDRIAFVSNHERKP